MCYTTTGICYLYFYPIFSSIIAGFIFWIIFSFFPSRQRHRSFNVGITNDLLKLNNLLFQWFDAFLIDQEYSPSRFQDKIHASKITEEEFNLFLQNKILGINSNHYSEISDKLLVIGDKLKLLQAEIDEVIKRLYSFNIFLSSDQVKILRDIQEKIFRYSLNESTDAKNNGIKLYPVDPTISYMTKTLLDLQEDYLKIRTIIFNKKDIDRNFSIQKTQRFFYMKEYKKCIKECDSEIRKSPYDSDLQLSYKIRSLMKLKMKNEAYARLEDFLNKCADIISYREFFYEIMQDSIGLSMISRKFSKNNIEEMREIIEDENLSEKAFLTMNAELKKFYSEKKNLSNAS